MIAQPMIDFEVASPTTCIVALFGEHDVSTEPQVAQTMVLAAAYSYVLTDLTRCTFLDSLIVGALARGAGTARARGGQLVFAAAPGPDHVRRTLERMGLDHLIALHASRMAGIAKLGQFEEARRAAMSGSRALQGGAGGQSQFSTTASDCERSRSSDR